jgi:LPXTG-motif cell wall-anchored protein
MLVSESDWSSPFNILDPQITNNGEGRYWLMSIAGDATALNISAEVQAVLGVVPTDNVCISLTTTRQEVVVIPPNTFTYRNTSEFSPCLGFTPTAVTLTSVRVHSGGTLPALALAGFGLLAVSAAGVFVWRRRKQA